ncbi:MAG: hypothetical protein ACKVPX_11990 [Myxococcaceae bacterium]
MRKVAATFDADTLVALVADLRKLSSVGGDLLDLRQAREVLRSAQLLESMVTPPA